MKATLFFSIFFLAVTSCSNINNEQISRYNRLANYLNQISIGNDLNVLFHNYYFEKGHFPKSMYDFYYWLADSADIIFFKKRYLLDPFAIGESLFDSLGFFYPKTITNDMLLAYLPLYDRESNLPVSYLFLARGEDGVFNNDIHARWYMDDWYHSIKAYNLEDILSQIGVTIVLYPVYHRQLGRFIGTHSIAFADSIIEQISLQGDTISISDFQNLWKYYENTMHYFLSVFSFPKFSRRRAIFGRKDFIVGFGHKVVRYEIVLEGRE